MRFSLIITRLTKSLSRRWVLQSIKASDYVGDLVVEGANNL